MQQFKTRKGRPHPLGAKPEKDGVNFSVFSQNATSVELLLFENKDDKEPFQVISFDPARDDNFNFWNIFVDGLQPGCYYTYRIYGPDDKSRGHKFNSKKIIIDPYAKSIDDTLWSRKDAISEDDNLASSMRAMITDLHQYEWEGDRPLNKLINETVIYEMHVGTFTKHPSADAKNAGKFAGVIEKIPYLKELGITAVELLPVFEFDDKEGLPQSGLKNYWGYGTVGFFAPERSYLINPDSPTCLDEFRDLVKALHKADIEVILDVVFGYTGEGNEGGPVINFKGLDNSIYYMLPSDNKETYMNFSGCGNTLNCNHPIVTKFITDCLEFWVKEMHVDGFRFDEASIMSRNEDGSVMTYPPVLWAIELSGVLSETKIIAEAWDAAGLYQVGYFPGYRWAQWNGHFRDDIRRFVRGDVGIVGQVAQRIAGSADIYESTGQLPINSINFITVHDGFTMNDLVSYDNKHNEANGENNRDGIDENLSWNCGYEGNTDIEEVENLRRKQIKNFASILLTSRGVPMILSGDEIRRTQYGNNNTYCQDNDMSWFDWSLVDKNSDILRFFRQMIKFRKRNYILHSKTFYRGELNEEGIPDITFHGCKVFHPGWNDPTSKVLSVTFGAKSNDTDIHMMANMTEENLEFELPEIKGKQWFRFADTSLPSPEDIAEFGQEVPIKGDKYLVNNHSVVIMVSK